MRAKVKYVKRNHKRYIRDSDQHFSTSIVYESSFEPLCSNCGKDLEKGFTYCPYCGCTLDWSPTDES